MSNDLQPKLMILVDKKKLNNTIVPLFYFMSLRMKIQSVEMNKDFPKIISNYACIFQWKNIKCFTMFKKPIKTTKKAINLSTDKGSECGERDYQSLSMSRYKR